MNSEINIAGGFSKLESNILIMNLKVGIAQISPIWLDRQSTENKIVEWIAKASEERCDLVVFGETILPGYPFWVEKSDGARFNSDLQKEIYALYLDQAVDVRRGDLDSICRMAAQKEIAVYLGCAEKAADRGGHSVYCSLVYIDQKGEIGSVHRKLMPTYEERLVWAIGDGNGLVTHELGDFKLGGLNCWENWMVLSRASLYAQGEDLHIAVWPGSDQNTVDITRFIAIESRSFVISASGLLRKEDLPADFPALKEMMQVPSDFFANGGSCIASPDGSWIHEPLADKEALITAEIDHKLVRKERQNFDPAGHYSRPDVTQLVVNRERQKLIKDK